MDTLYCKYKNISRKKKQALHALIARFISFIFLFIITYFFEITLCPIQNFFGISCFGCGLTRGFIAILHLDFKTALHHHVLSIPIFIGITMYAILCISDILFDRNDIEHIENILQKKYMFVLYIIIIIISAHLNPII